jgi:hypothetical protein
MPVPTFDSKIVPESLSSISTGGIVNATMSSATYENIVTFVNKHCITENGEWCKDFYTELIHVSAHNSDKYSTELNTNCIKVIYKIISPVSASFPDIFIHIPKTEKII